MLKFDFLKKLSVWLVLIKVTVWGINYQKEPCIYKGIYFILFFFINFLDVSLFHTYEIIYFIYLLNNNNNNNKYILLVLF